MKEAAQIERWCAPVSRGADVSGWIVPPSAEPSGAPGLVGSAAPISLSIYLHIICVLFTYLEKASDNADFVGAP